MKPLKVGDRVRAFGGIDVLNKRHPNGDPVYTFSHSGIVGTVTKIYPGVSVEIDGLYCCHRKQLRLLKPKAKPREIWVNEYDELSLIKLGGVCSTESEATNSATNLGKRIAVVRFREVERKLVKK